MVQQIITRSNTVPTGMKFIGFSTQDLSSNRKYTLYNVDLVKQDLLNQFYTRKGERVMLPNFGTIIWDKLFETLNAVNKQEIIDDVVRIVKSEPRVTLQNVIVEEVEYGIIVAIDLWYAPQNMTTTLSVNFTNQSQSRNITGV